MKGGPERENEEKAAARRQATLLLAIGFAIAERIGGAATARSAETHFADAEAFVKAAEARGLDPQALGS